MLANKIMMCSSKLDPYAVALLHMNGANNSTTFTDETGKIWTPHGNAKLTTTSPKFGTASATFDGTGDWIDTPDSEDFNFGTGDLTIHFWLKRLAGGAGILQRILGQADVALTNSSSSMYAVINNSNSLGITVCIGSSGTTSTSTITITDTTTWHHIAYVKSGNTLKVYIDGVGNTGVTVSGAINNSSQVFSIGRAGAYASDYLFANIDELCILKGTAKWTSNFTPPTYES